ncbi:MAG: HEAT repeat domain-containing protein [Polyangiales bacterium]
MLRLLDDADDTIRAAAAQRLAAVRHPTVTEALRAHLRDDPDDDVRAACVRALAGRDDVLDALRAALDDRASFVRMAVPSALSAAPREAQREALGALLEGAPTALAVEAARALAARGDAPAAAYLLSVMRGDRPALRAQAAVAASALAAAHGPALAALLEGDDAEVTLRVAGALTRVDAHRDAAVRALRRLSNSPDGFVAVRALQARATLGDAGLADPLRDALTSPDAGVRRIAVLAWSELAGNTGDLDTLAAMMRDEDRSVVALAASQIILAAAR